MKLTVFAFFILAFMIGLTMVQVDSNTGTPFETLSKAEMQTTEGAGTCEEVVVNWDPDAGCEETFCEREWKWNRWNAYDVDASLFGVCGLSYTQKRHCYKTDDKGQECAVKWKYASPFCIDWFRYKEPDYISTFNRTSVPDPDCTTS